MREVEWETIKWVDWYNNRRLPGPIGTSRPQKQRRRVSCKPEHTRYGRVKMNKSPSDKPGAVQIADRLTPCDHALRYFASTSLIAFTFPAERPLGSKTVPR